MRESHDEGLLRAAAEIRVEARPLESPSPTAQLDTEVPRLRARCKKLRGRDPIGGIEAPAAATANRSADKEKLTWAGLAL